MVRCCDVTQPTSRFGTRCRRTWIGGHGCRTVRHSRRIAGPLVRAWGAACDPAPRHSRRTAPPPTLADPPASDTQDTIRSVGASSADPLPMHSDQPVRWQRAPRLSLGSDRTPAGDRPSTVSETVEPESLPSAVHDQRHFIATRWIGARHRCHRSNLSASLNSLSSSARSRRSAAVWDRRRSAWRIPSW